MAVAYCSLTKGARDTAFENRRVLPTMSSARSRLKVAGGATNCETRHGYEFSTTKPQRRRVSGGPTGPSIAGSETRLPEVVSGERAHEGPRECERLTTVGPLRESGGLSGLTRPPEAVRPGRHVPRARRAILVGCILSLRGVRAAGGDPVSVEGCPFLQDSLVQPQARHRESSLR